MIGLVACSGQPAQWTGRVVDLDGVRRIENPAEPLAASGEVRYALRWLLTGPESGDIWEAPNKLHVMRDLIYVVDRQASKVHLATTSGEMRPALGEPGSGPGQYRRIVDAIPTEAGLFVVDGGNGRIEILGDSGERIASYPLGFVAFNATRLGEHSIAVFGMLGDAAGWTKIDDTGTRTPLDVADFEVTPQSPGAASSVSSWQDKLVRLRYVSPQARLYSTDGRLETVIDIPLPVEEASDAEIERLVNEVTAVLARDGFTSGRIQRQVDLIRSRPRAKNRFRKIEFDDAAGLAAIWEQNPEDFGSGNAAIHLLSSDGIYLALLQFDRTWADCALSDGVLYVLARDLETDLVTLTAYELVMPPVLLQQARRLAQQVSQQQ